MESQLRPLKTHENTVQSRAFEGQSTRKGKLEEEIHHSALGVDRPSSLNTLQNPSRCGTSHVRQKGLGQRITRLSSFSRMCSLVQNRATAVAATDIKTVNSSVILAMASNLLAMASNLHTSCHYPPLECHWEHNENGYKTMSTRLRIELMPPATHRLLIGLWTVHVRVKAIQLRGSATEPFVFSRQHQVGRRWLNG